MAVFVFCARRVSVESTMILLQAIFAFVVQAAGRILNTVFGWAMVMLFGRVPANKQLLLTLISLTSVLWVLTILGVVFPRAGTWMISCIHLPDFVDDTPIRLCMLPGAVMLPLLVGFWSLLLTETEQRPQGVRAVVRELMRGYKFAVGIASTFTLMLLLMPIMKVRDLFKRCHSEHIPVMIRPEDYGKVVDEVRQLLEDEGYQIHRVKTTWMLALPTKLLSYFARTSINTFVANELATLKWNRGEIVIHPCDLVVRGTRSDVTYVQAWIIQNLALGSAYFTWHKEAHSVEDQLRQMRLRSTQILDRAGLTTLVSCLSLLDERLCRLSLPAEEWCVLYRELLQVKCKVFEMTLAEDMRPKS